jgi:hypothetical protein
MRHFSPKKGFFEKKRKTPPPPKQADQVIPPEAKTGQPRDYY